MVWWSSLTVSFPSLYVIATSKYARVVDVGSMLVRGGHWTPCFSGQLMTGS